MNKKKLLILALAVIMIAIVSFSTLAWFSDSDTVTNEFLVAGSDNADPDKVFSVAVWEKVPGETTDDGYEYTNILPGDCLEKKVYVENTGSYEQYMRVIVTISDAEAWINAMGEDFNASTLFGNFDASKWTHIWNNLSEATEMPENLIFVLYYKEVLGVNESVVVFTDVNIPTTLTQEQAAAFAGGFTIDVKAQAVQTKNVVPEGTAAEDAAWAAFRTVGMNIAD